MKFTVNNAILHELGLRFCDIFMYSFCVIFDTLQSEVNWFNRYVSHCYLVHDFPVTITVH